LTSLSTLDIQEVLLDSGRPMSALQVSKMLQKRNIEINARQAYKLLECMAKRKRWSPVTITTATIDARKTYQAKKANKVQFLPAQIEAVQKQLLPTWQPVAAIAMRAELHPTQVHYILRDNAKNWDLQCVRSAIDQHNLVHSYRMRPKVRLQQFLGVTVVVDNGEVEQV
jgi:3-Deoxy-D-manno-octulosonic-acid transferase (kdotransferase)